MYRFWSFYGNKIYIHSCKATNRLVDFAASIFTNLYLSPARSFRWANVWIPTATQHIQTTMYGICESDETSHFEHMFVVWFSKFNPQSSIPYVRYCDSDGDKITNQHKNKSCVLLKNQSPNSTVWMVHRLKQKTWLLNEKKNTMENMYSVLFTFPHDFVGLFGILVLFLLETFDWKMKTRLLRYSSSYSA